MNLFWNISRILFDESGAGGGAGGSGSGSNNANGGGNTGTKTFTQAELDSMFSERAQRGKETGQAEIFKALGVQNSDELKSLVDAARQASEKTKTETERLQSQITTLTAERDQIKLAAEQRFAQANERLMQSALMVEASKLNFRPESLVDIFPLVKGSAEMMKKLKIDDGSLAVSGVEDVIKEVAKARPHWLAVSSTGTSRTGGGNNTGQSSRRTGGSSQQGNESKPRINF